MNLTTPVSIPILKKPINYKERGLVLGSCFSEHIGRRLLDGGMNVVVNPYGVIFNPHSIGDSFESIVSGRIFDKLVFDHGLWHSFDHHGSFSDPDSEKVLRTINRPLPQQYDYAILTLGTAWVYETEGRVVANCHKIAASKFVRRRMTLQQVKQSLMPVIDRLEKVILTVSPIRHIKDGLSENQVSKSILRVACTELSEQFPERVYYFPSYEIMVDELRDYRFYASDMCHPTEQAQSYIWQRFQDATLDTPSKEMISRVEALRRALSHRPLHATSPEYIQFRLKTREKIEELLKIYPNLLFREGQILGVESHFSNLTQESI